MAPPRSTSKSGDPAEGETSSDSSPASSAPTESGSTLGLVGRPFTPAKEPPAAQTVRDLEQPEYEPPPPEPIEWTEERAQLILRGAGWMLHSLDPLADSPYGADLWKMTEEELDAIAAPAARIANRYDVTRVAAGASDEIGLGMSAWPYLRRNLAQRGRIRALEQQARDAARPELAYQPQAPPPAAAPAPPPPVDPLAPPPVEFADPDAVTGITGDDLGMFGPSDRPAIRTEFDT